MDMNEIRKWAKENFPSIMGNEKLMIAMYRKRVGGEDIRDILGDATVKYSFRRIADLKADKGATIFYTKVDIRDVKEIEVCAVCGRKNCMEVSHSGKKILYIVSLVGGDSSGEIIARRMTYSKEEVDILRNNDFFIFQGMMKDSERWGKDFNIKRIVSLTLEESKEITIFTDFFELNDSVAGIDVGKWNKLVQGHKAVEKLLRYIWVKEEDGRIFL